jgi:hypothetical protein
MPPSLCRSSHKKRRRGGQLAAEKTFLVFRSYNIRQPHYTAFDRLSPAAQRLAVLSESIGDIFADEDDGDGPSPLGAPVPKSALRTLLDPDSPEYANFERGSISTELEDLAYKVACERIVADPDATWREARRAEGRAAVTGQELLLAEISESMPKEPTQKELKERKEKSIATTHEERRKTYAPTIARFRDPDLQMTESPLCVYEFSDGKKCTYDKKAGDPLFCSQCRLLVEDPLVVPPPVDAP